MYFGGSVCAKSAYENLCWFTVKISIQEGTNPSFNLSLSIATSVTSHILVLVCELSDYMYTYCLVDLTSVDFSDATNNFQLH